MSNPPITIAVIGGGIAGMSAAYELSEALDENLEIHLIEAGQNFGGKIQTEHNNGWIMELGPDSFLATKPWAVQLCRDLGIEDTLIGTNPDQRAVYILHRDALRPIPEGLVMMVPTDIAAMATSPLLSPLGKVRAAIEPLLPAKRDLSGESIQEFISRRFGSELYRHLVEPMMSGIYAGDGSKLSIEATFPILKKWEREHGSVVRGALKLRSSRRKSPSHKPRDRPKSLFLTPRDGLSSIIDALSSVLSDRGIYLHLDTAIEAIEAYHAGFKLYSQDNKLPVFDGVIMTTPSFVSGRLVRTLSKPLSQKLEAIEYASTATVNFAYRDPEVSTSLTGYGYVIPQAEARSALACTWTSTKFPHRAPPGTALLRVFLGRAGQQDILDRADEGLIEAAREELRLTIGLIKKPDHVKLERWPQAMPQYNVGHSAHVQTIMQEVEKLPGLKLAGAAFHGIGIPDCIKSGRLAARQLLAELSNQPSRSIQTP